MKIFSFAAAAALCLAGVGLFAACSNLGDDYAGPQLVPVLPGVSVGGGPVAAQVQQNYLTASVAVNLPGAAVAQKISASSAEMTDGVSKSAFPGLGQLADAGFSFGATLASDGGTTYIADGIYDDTAGTCSFAFAGARSDAAATYTLTVTLYYNDAGVKKTVASASQEVLVAAGASTIDANMTLAPNSACDVNGTIELPIEFSDTSVTSVQVKLIDASNTDVAATYLGSSAITLTSGVGTIASVAGGLPPGTYKLLMSFVKGSAVVGSRTETLNVFPALKTSAWWTNGAAGTTLSVDAYNQTEFWVRGTGGKFYSEVYTASTEAKDTNVGSFAAPLATVQAAVDKINATGNTTTQYTVYIDGKVTGDADAVYSNYALVHLNKERKILFKGWSGPDTDIIDVNKKKTDTGPATQGHAFYVITSSPITLQNLGIVNATGSGGGVSSHGGALTVSRTGADVTVLDCKISDCWDYSGGAISVMLGSVKVKNSVLTKNKASTGGAIYVNGTSSFVTIEDSEIYGNTADSGSGGQGGGVYVTSGGTVYFKSGIIGSDDASKGNNAKAVGGGVFVNGSSTSSGKFYMSGSARIAGNSAKNTAGTEGYGGGVYVASGGIFCMSGSAIVGQKKTGNAPAATAANGERSNYAPTKGGGVYIIQPDGLKLGYKDETTPDPTFDGGIYYNYANSGGGIYASFDSAGGALEIERGSVCYNGAGGDGGGIHGYTATGTYDAVIKITGGEVSCNSAGSGGGISAKTVYVGGGTIAGNTASSYGGGVYASSDFYLYGSGVIGDTSKAEIAKEDDCSNKAKAGGGVFAHHAYIGYSDASTPANCTGGVYRNYATAVKGSETYFYSGGGICVVGMAANWLFKMQSGTVAYNAGDSSDGYGGGLFIYGSGAIDSSITYPQVTGGSFVGNGAKYGGALCCYSNSFALGDSVYMPSATGKKGDNDIYLNNTKIKILSDLTATPTPVVTVTPSATYSTSVQVVTDSAALLPANCDKIGVGDNEDGIPWVVSSSGYLAKDCAIVYVAATDASPTGSDTSGNGTAEAPYATIYRAAQDFSNAAPDLGGTTYEPIFKNKIYVLSDMTWTSGAGAKDDVAYNYEVVGCAGGVVGTPVTFTFNVPSGSGFYAAPSHKVRLKNINITQSSGTNDYAALMAAVGGELFVDDCSITGMRANKCSAIAAEGAVHLKNVSVKNNVAIAPSDGGYVWGPAVFSKQGQISLMGKIEINGNYMEIPDGGGAGGTVQKEQNVWLGDNMEGTPVYNHLYIAGTLASGTSVGVNTYDISKTVFTENFKDAGNGAAQLSYFTSDAGMGVGWNSTSKEAELSVPLVSYVSSTSATPAGSDLTGNGTAAKPFATLQKALDVLDGYGAMMEYTINVSGQVLGASQIKSGIHASKITIAGTSAATDKLKGSSSDAVLTINEAIPADISDLTIAGGKRGVDIEAGATVTISGCNITDNTTTASVDGAGIYMAATVKPSLTITGGEVSGNSTAGKGAGVCVMSGTFNSTNLEISGNESTGSNGGGIYVSTTGVEGFKMTGGQISGNKAKAGGGADLQCQDAASPLLDGVTISGNQATAGNGGGIFVTSGKYLSIKDCVVINNTATGGNGGGIYNAGTCYIYGSTAIGEEGASSPAQADDDKHSNIANATTGATPTGGSGGGIYNASTLYLGYYKDSSSVKPDTTFSGGVWYNYAADMGGGVCNAGTMMMSKGSIVRNGAKYGGAVANIDATATFAAGSMDYNAASTGGGGIFNKKSDPADDTTSSVVNLNGIFVTGNTVPSTGGGGGVMNQYGTLNFTAGQINFNSGGTSGGGVLNFGTMNMSGGTISSNSATNGGGVYAYQNTFSMTSGTISGNTASSGNGGGVYINNLDAGGGTTYVGEFEISGDATVPYGTGNDIFAENAVTIGGDLTSAGIVGKIRLRSTDYVSGRIVLKDGAGAVADNYDKFAVSNDSSGGIWKISDTGYIYQAGTSSGAITVYTPDGKLGFTLDKTTILGSGTVKVTAVDPTNGDAAIDSSLLSGWSISAYYGVDAIKTVTTNQYEFTTAYPVGSYTLNVSVTYKGTTYSDAFAVTKSYAGSKAPGAALAVGDIVFADGSATPYSSGLSLTADQKSAAIAVIFDATKKLGVGLKQSQKAWCTSAAKANSLNITSIQCSVTGSVGAYTFDGDTDGSDNLDQIASFLGGNNDTGTSSRYPAFYFAKNYKSTATNVVGTPYETGWYLPSVAELYEVYKNKSVLNSALGLCGGTSFGTSIYFSSSQHNTTDNYAFTVYFETGYYGGHPKVPSSNTYWVCAVHQF